MAYQAIFKVIILAILVSFLHSLLLVNTTKCPITFHLNHLFNDKYIIWTHRLKSWYEVNPKQQHVFLLLLLLVLFIYFFPFDNFCNWHCSAAWRRCDSCMPRFCHFVTEKLLIESPHLMWYSVVTGGDFPPGNVWWPIEKLRQGKKGKMENIEENEEKWNSEGVKWGKIEKMKGEKSEIYG